MMGYTSNSECILDYLSLFQALCAEKPDEEDCRAQWNRIQTREEQTGDHVQFAPPYFRQRFALSQRDFLLAMAALALEMDGGLRNGFRRRYAMTLPTIEYGLQIIEPLSPSDCETLAELAGKNPLCALLLTNEEPTAYPLERPLILCRGVLAFLTGLSQAEIPGCTMMLRGEDRAWLPLHSEALEEVVDWYGAGATQPLTLCAPPGAGRHTLLLQACGDIVCVALEVLASMSDQNRNRTLQEAAVLAKLLNSPLCMESKQGQQVLPEYLRFCRKHQIPTVILAEEDGDLIAAQRVVRLSRQLTPFQRETAWRAFVPNTEENAAPDGAMTVGAVKETAELALGMSLRERRRTVSRSNVRAAMLRRGGAMEFGIRYEVDVSLDDMVLSDGTREQLELICQAAQSGARLADWGLPRQREGVTAVFHGPSGTGKTMASWAIAGRLGLPLLRADLSQIMDKYVGETEKHLGRLLRSARENRCVLLFDEADSLFGKRASVSSGNDKYANLSTSYLLQEIENYDGVALLSTNLLSNFDEAFLRRLHYIVRFSLPDASLREQIWQRAIPPERREGELPFSKFAQAELSPARIFAAARSAAVSAMSAGREQVDVTALAKALRLELEKGGKALPRDFVNR